MKRLTLLAFFLTGCLNVGVDRAEFDETVGAKTSGQAEVEVVNGLAAIREFEEGSLTLWGSAPTFEINLDTGQQTSWTLKIKNAMGNAQLESDSVVVTEVETGIETTKEWTFDASVDSSHTFRLTSEIDETRPWRFVVFADVQDHIDDVQDIYDTMKLDPTIKFGLISGDLTEQGSAESLQRFQDEMETLPFPCFATLGNHELGSGETTFHEFFGRGNFSFAYGGTFFTLLDSASATIAAPVWPWIDRWIEEANGRPHLTMMHIPPLDVSGQRNGGFASRQEANRLLGVLGRGGVDILFYGHVHTYAAYRQAGIPAYITGGGGAIPMRLDGIGRHFLKVDIDPSAATFTPGLVRVYPE